MEMHQMGPIFGGYQPVFAPYSAYPMFGATDMMMQPVYHPHHVEYTPMVKVEYPDPSYPPSCAFESPDARLPSCYTPVMVAPSSCSSDFSSSPSSCSRTPSPWTPSSCSFESPLILDLDTKQPIDFDYQQLHVQQDASDPQRWFVSSAKSESKTNPSKLRSPGRNSPRRLLCGCRNCASGQKNHGEHPCDRCAKVFRKATHLRSHLLAHDGIRPYECDFPGCGKSFVRSDELHRHARIHLLTRPYACEVCGKGFYRTDHLKKHRSVHEYLS